MKSHVLLSSAALACFTLSLASCGPPERAAVAIPNKLPTFPVTGEVLVDGAPGTLVTVKFNPVTPINTSGYLVTATVGPDGKFKASTYGKDDGAPAGEYALTFFRRMQNLDGAPGDDDLGERYETVENSPKKVVVEKGPLDIGKIELTTK